MTMSLNQRFFSWRPPKYIRERSQEQHQRLREKYHILVDGEDVPPPIEDFAVCRALDQSVQVNSW